MEVWKWGTGFGVRTSVLPCLYYACHCNDRPLIYPFASALWSMPSSPPLQPDIPRHEQVSNWLREQIQSGVYEPGDQLPSESALGDQFGVSRVTVRRALQTVENEGYIYRRQGLGSFVQTPPVRQGLVRLTDFAQDMRQAGLKARSEVLAQKLESATPRVANLLGLKPGDKVERLDRLRLADTTPIAFDRTFLPVFYAQLLRGHDLEHETIYTVLASYDIDVERGRYRIEAVDAPDDVAEYLGIPAASAVLRISRTSFATGGKIIYYQQRFYRSDRVAYELELERDPAGRDISKGMSLQEFEPVFRRTDTANDS